METDQPKEEQTSLELKDSKPGKNLKKNSQAEVVPASQPDNWISQALDSGRSMDEIQQFLNMRKEEMKELERRAFLSAFKSFQEDVPELIKNKEGALKRYKYAELPELQKMLRKPLAAHGFSVSWDQDDTGDKVVVTCTLSHEGGHEKTSRLSGTPQDVVSGNDNATNGIQKKAALITYLRRYTYTAVLGISSGDRDTDGTVPPTTSLNKRKPAQGEFNDVLKKITSGQMTLADAEKVYSFSAEQMTSISALTGR